MNKLFEFFRIKRIWLKFAATVILAVLLTMSFTSYLRLLNNEKKVQEQIASTLETTIEVASLAVSDPLWNYNIDGIEAIGESVFKRKEINSVKISDLRRGEIYSRTIENSIHPDEQIYKQELKIYKSDIYIGTIEIGITDYYFVKEVRDEFYNRINDMFIQVFILVIFISLISVTVTTPLKKLEQGAIEVAEGNYSNKIEVNSSDEVGMLAEKFNYMAENIKSAREEFIQMNSVLEELVKERTDQLVKTNEYLEVTLGESEETQAELTVKNDELEIALETLRETREELIQTAKSSLTSQLVAGVAHEINTPVGVSLTTSSFLQTEVTKLLTASNEGSLTKSDFVTHLSAIGEAASTIQRNLENSASLIESFKQVAVDQTGHRKRSFNLKDYIEEVLKNLHSAFKHTHHDITLECPDDINLDSYPGAYSQVLTNLLMNTLEHGFKERDDGHISIKIDRDPKGLIINYSDDGHGIDPKDMPHIFIPFYSTAHGKGGSGLGLSVINNLVTTVLGGTIQCESVMNKNTTFTMVIPESPTWTNPHDGSI